MKLGYSIANAHAHIYPDKIAEKATAAVGRFYGIPMDMSSGSPDLLLSDGAKVGAARYLVSSVATTPEQVEHINDFIHRECELHPEFLGLMAMHQSYASYETEIARCKALGFVGVKFHPDFQRFYIDDPAMDGMYRAIAKAGLIIQFHMGDRRYEYSSPERLAAVVERIPELRCIAAHFGGYSEWEAADALLSENVWFDTSSSLFELSAEDAVRKIRTAGAERFFFGTDFPMWLHEDELDRFLALPLTEEERRMILRDNFAKFFSVSV